MNYIAKYRLLGRYFDEIGYKPDSVPILFERSEITKLSILSEVEGLLLDKLGALNVIFPRKLGNNIGGSYLSSPTVTRRIISGTPTYIL